MVSPLGSELPCIRYLTPMCYIYIYIYTHGDANNSREGLRQQLLWPCHIWKGAKILRSVDQTTYKFANLRCMSHWPDCDLPPENSYALEQIEPWSIVNSARRQKHHTYLWSQQACFNSQLIKLQNIKGGGPHFWVLLGPLNDICHACMHLKVDFTWWDHSGL